MPAWDIQGQQCEKGDLEALKAFKIIKVFINLALSLL